MEKGGALVKKLLAPLLRRRHHPEPRTAADARFWIAEARHGAFTGRDSDGAGGQSQATIDPLLRCALFLQPVRNVICAAEDPNVAEFLLDVLAANVPQPATLTEVAIVARGDQGVGKNSLTEYDGALSAGTPRRSIAGTRVSE